MAPGRGVTVAAINAPVVERDRHGKPLPVANIKRQTGRTTHQLKNAIEAARRGKRVLYVIPSSAFADYASALLRKLAPDTVRWPAEDRAWKVGDGCIVFRFVKPTEVLRDGSPLLREVRSHDGMLFVDHAVWDQP